MVSPFRIRIMALVTLVGMGALGLFLINLRGMPLGSFWAGYPVFEWESWKIFVKGLFNRHGVVVDYLKGRQTWQSQILMGLGLGFIFSLCAHFILTRRFMEKVNQRYRGLLSAEKLSWGDILFLSASAGIGEELLFRGGLQYYWGIWFTAIVFVAIHGYLNPRDWRISIYGGFMTLAMAILGYVTESYGIASAIIAHAFIDLWLLGWMKTEEKMEKEIKTAVNKEAREILGEKRRLLKSKVE